MNYNMKRINFNILFILISIATLLIIHNYFMYSHIFEDVSAWGTFYTVFGVLYAIIAGFLIIEALSKYTSLQSLIEEEINNLQDMRDLVIYLSCEPKIVQKIIYELQGYVQSISTIEWDSMKKGNKVGNSDTTKEMYEIFDAINNMSLEDKKDEIALKLLMQKMTEITTLRTKRISVATQKLPYSLKILLYFMSSTLILGLMLMGVHSVIVHIFMVVSLIISVQLLNSIIVDIDNPFEGLWKIDPTLFQDFSKTLENQHKKLKNLE